MDSLGLKHGQKVCLTQNTRQFPAGTVLYVGPRWEMTQPDDVCLYHQPDLKTGFALPSVVADECLAIVA